MNARRRAPGCTPGKRQGGGLERSARSCFEVVFSADFLAEQRRVCSCAEVIGSVAKWLCCPLREATSAALPYTRRAGFLVVPESTRPVQPRSTQPPAPQPPKGTLLQQQYYCGAPHSRKRAMQQISCCRKQFARGATSSTCNIGAKQRTSVIEQCSKTIVGSDWPEMPLRHASNPCDPFSLCASANCCVPGPP